MIQCALLSDHRNRESRNLDISEFIDFCIILNNLLIYFFLLLRFISDRMNPSKVSS